MANWSWSPQYRCYIKTAGKVWTIKTLQSAQCLLTTGQGVNQAALALADPDGFIAKTVAPKPMSLVQIWSRNRFGQGGVVWTGYVDSVSRAFDPEQGSGVTLACTGPVKLFEITRQSPGDVASLAVAYARNIAASSVLKYAAKACGYPSSLLHIHPVADSGSGYQQIGAGPFVQPDQQPWSSVVSSIVSNAGLEWFYGARGECYFRALDFINPWFPSGSANGRPSTLRPRAIGEDDIIHADFAQSDQGIVTDVQVRWAGGGGFVQSAVTWPEPGHESAAHRTMVAHLRTRRLVVYAPWLYNKQAAQYLAQVLYLQYAAGVAQASVTIPADPLIEVGSLVDVPALGTGGTQATRYYVTSITAQLAWGGAWVYTLTLAYGHAPGETFPYTGKVQWPAVTGAMRHGVAQPGPIAALDAANPAWDNTAYTLVAQAGLGKDQAAIATTAYPVGSTVLISSKPHSKGALVGPAPLGEYKTIAPSNAAQSDTTIALLSTKVTTGYITIKEIGAAVAPEVDGGAVTAVADVSATPLPNSAVDAGASGGTRSTTSSFIGPVGGKPQLNALTAATAHVNDLYKFDHAGPDGWDCSGLVAAAYADIGLPQLVYSGGGGSFNTDKGPNGIYDFFARNGATMIDPSDAVAGDLLFWQDNSGSGYWNSQNGFRHVGFCSGPNETFQALGPNETRSIGYYPLSAAPFNLALRMADVTWGHLS